MSKYLVLKIIAIISVFIDCDIVTYQNWCRQEELGFVYKPFFMEFMQSFQVLLQKKIFILSDWQILCFTRSHFQIISNYNRMSKGVYLVWETMTSEEEAYGIRTLDTK